MLRTPPRIALFSLGVLAFLAALTACGGGSSASAPPITAYTADIQYISAFGGVLPSPGAPRATAAPFVLYDQQFLDPFSASYLLSVAITPQLSSTPTVTWTASNANVTLSPQEPFTFGLPGDPIPTAPPGDIFVQTGSTYGSVTIVAAIGAPVQQTVTLTAYHYPSLSFGCRFRYAPAFAFDPGAQSNMQNSANWTSADLYDTYPSAGLGSFDPCLGSPLATAPGSAEAWHAQFGGILLPTASLQGFAAISAAQWSNAGTTFTPQASTVLLFKTKGGRIVKAMLPIGPVETGDTNGVFPY